MPALKTRLPSLYHDRLPEVIDEAYPDERFATCESCVNCQSSTSPYLTTKCCTYYPSLPNYLVGGVLNQPTNDEGRERVRAIISSRVGVSPYGLLRPASRRSLPSTRPVPSRADAEAMLCPYYDAGRCSIWAHREHLCSAFFCYSVGGGPGRAFWDALDQYLSLVEHELSLHALLTVGWPIEQLRLTNPLPDWRPAKTPDEDRQRREVWRDWIDREADLYIECHRVVAATDRRTIESLLGWKGRHLETRLRELLDEFRKAVVPERLEFTAKPGFTTEDGDHVRVGVGVGVDSSLVRVPRVAAAFLSHFDGVRGTTEVVRLAASVSVDMTRHLDALRAAGVLRDVSLAPGPATTVATPTATADSGTSRSAVVSLETRSR